MSKSKNGCYNNPVQRVGVFMQESKDIYMEQQCLYAPRKDSKFIQLYYVESYSQRQILPLFFYIYGEENKSIKSHQILICGPSTTKISLEQTFQCAKTFIDTYIIVGINDLRIQIQEVRSPCSKVTCANLNINRQSGTKGDF